MQNYYYVNRNSQIGGEHEVHTSSCGWLPKLENRIFLGEFSNCFDALNAARKYYGNVDGCMYCCLPCHTK